MNVLKSSLVLLLGGLTVGCFSDKPEGLMPSQSAQTTVKFDFYHKPLPDIPMPNDLATRVDKTSATGIRVNASTVANTLWERRTRELADRIDGWGTMQPITIPFTGPLGIDSIVAGHRDTDYDFSNDVVYLINVDPDSQEYGKVHYTDIGEGNFPISVKEKDHYWKHDPRIEATTLLFEEYDEDLNGNGVLDPGEDTDADGTLDKPNYYPGANPDWDDLAARSDAHMSFYERETNTLIVRPLMPLRERTTYAVVVTRRLLDESGRPVGSPFEWVNHTSQTRALKNLLPVMPEYFGTEDIAFAFTYTTQTVQSAMIAVRDGLYGHGVQAHMAETPVDVSLLPMRDDEHFPGLVHEFLLRGEDWGELLPLLGTVLLNSNRDSESERAILRAAKYIDFFSAGYFESPQLRKRYDEDGNFLNLNDQSWPEDLDRVEAEVTNERVYFTLMVPRKEVSDRGEGKPAPLILVTHGHSSNRAEMLLTSTWFAQHGFATLAIDAPGHGLGADQEEIDIMRSALESIGLGKTADALINGRAIDLNGDGNVDSGDDFWTSYLFHTRDNVRQYALDLMHTTKIMRSFDGTRTWMDVDRDGEVDLAGDFDGDGNVDIGGDGEIVMFGGSMGGITAMIMGGLEPELSAIVPVVGGGVMSDIGFRSDNGSVPGSFFLQGVMGPLWAGTLDDDGEMLIEHIVEELADNTDLEVARVQGVERGDLMIVENVRSGDIGCGYVAENGGVRAGTEVNYFDPVKISFYRGVQVVEGTHCEMSAETEPVAVVDRFGNDVYFKGYALESGATLQALGEGVARLRSHPNLRRMRGLGQLILDPGDPINFARHVLDEPLTYPGTGQTTGAHVLSVSTLGDMNVPTATGINWGRAAGLINFLDVDPRYGKSVNQMLIDTHTIEGVSTHKRYVDEYGDGVLIDVEHFSLGMNDKWGDEYPRLAEPLRIGFDEPDSLGGKSSVIFPLTLKTGEHGFTMPGGFLDEAIEDCEWECFEQGPECTCEDVTTYDVGYFIVNLVARWITSDCEVLDPDLCNSRNDCPGLYLTPPEIRSTEDRL